jgi:hypothetical protein
LVRFGVGTLLALEIAMDLLGSVRVGLAIVGLAIGLPACDDGGVHYIYKPDAAASDAGAPALVTVARPGAPAAAAVPSPPTASCGTTEACRPPSPPTPAR